MQLRVYFQGQFCHQFHRTRTDSICFYRMDLGLGNLVDSYQDSRKALSQFAEVDPGYYELVVLDIRMPNLNGLEFYRKLKVINGKIKVIFVSALDASDELCSMLSEFNPDNLLRKPLESNQLIAAVKRVLSGGTENAIITGR